MSKLLAKLKKEAERVKVAAEKRGGGEYTKIEWFKPKDGENMIRLLPHWSNPDEELFFRRVMIHFIPTRKNDGGMIQTPARCLRDLDEECPLCDKYEAMMARISKDDKEAREKARSLRPAERYLYNVVDYGSKPVKLLPFAAPITVHQAISEYFEDFGDDIVSLTNGRDWKLTKKNDPRKPKNLGTTYSIRPSIKETALPEKLKVLLEGVYNLDDLYSENRRKDMEAFLGISGGDEEEEEAVAPRSAAKAKAAAKEEDFEAPKFDEDEEIPESVAPKKKAAAPAPAKAKAKVKEEEDEESFEVEDGDLDEELRDLGVIP